MKDALLRTHLQAAVPLRILELRDATPEQLDFQARRYAAGDDWHDDGTLAAGAGDRETIARLTSTLAALAVAEGGVTFHGLHFCTDHDHCIKSGWRAA